MQDADRTVGLSADVKEIFLIVRESYAPVQGWRRRKQLPLFARLEIPDPQAVFARLDWHIRQQMRVRRNSHIQHMPVVGQADDLHGTKFTLPGRPLLLILTAGTQRYPRFGTVSIKIVSFSFSPS